jgi:hypothetical protein
MKFIKNLAVAIMHRGIQLSLKDPSSIIPKVFYCHVPKCAGSSISRAIRQQLFVGFKGATFKIDLRASHKSSQLSSMDAMRVREILLAYNLSNAQNYFGSGHVYCRPNVVEYYMNEWDFVTILRNPIDRWISEYVYSTYKDSDWQKNILPIDDYLASERGKVTGIEFIRYFSSMPNDYVGNVEEFIDEAVENLRRFSVIGTIEDIERWRESFNKRFNTDLSIPRINTSPRVGVADRIRSDDSIMKKIEELCEPDLRVYQRIVEMTKVSP